MAALTLNRDEPQPEQRPPEAANDEPTAEEPAEPGGGNYVLVPKNLGNPYFDTANVGAQEAAAELGVTRDLSGLLRGRCDRADPAAQLADRPERRRSGYLGQ